MYGDILQRVDVALSIQDTKSIEELDRRKSSGARRDRILELTRELPVVLWVVPFLLRALLQLPAPHHALGRATARVLLAFPSFGAVPVAVRLTAVALPGSPAV